MTGFERSVLCEPVRVSPAGAHASVKSSIQQLLFVVEGVGGILYALHVASADMATWQTILMPEGAAIQLFACVPLSCVVWRACVYGLRSI
jgi:hypothetical protein